MKRVLPLFVFVALAAGYATASALARGLPARLDTAAA